MTEKITREELQMILDMEDVSKDPAYSRWHSVRLARLKAIVALALQAEAMQPRPEWAVNQAMEAIKWAEGDGLPEAIVNVEALRALLSSLPEPRR